MKMALFPKSDIFDILATFVKKPILAILGTPPLFWGTQKRGGSCFGGPHPDGGPTFGGHHYVDKCTLRFPSQALQAAINNNLCVYEF